MGKHELLLAKDRAIEPIIAALESQDRAEVRPDLAEVLVSMMLRSDNPRIETALKHHLLDDPDPRVRGRIADKLGLHLKSEFFDVFLQAVADPSPTVQTAAMLALEHVLHKLDEEQTRTSLENAAAEDREVREGALFLVEEFVGSWAKKAREAALKANLSKADSLYNVALAYAPNSRQARYYLGTFYFDYGDRERELQFLRGKSTPDRPPQARVGSEDRRSLGRSSLEGRRENRFVLSPIPHIKPKNRFSKVP